MGGGDSIASLLPLPQVLRLNFWGARWDKGNQLDKSLDEAILSLV